MDKINRRHFLQSISLLAASSTLTACASHNNTVSDNENPVTSKKIVPMETVRVAFIGVGERGSGSVKHFCHLEGVEIKAICDTRQEAVNTSVSTVVNQGLPTPDTYGKDELDYQRMLERDDIDIVIISTPWRWHTPMAVDCMQSGKHAFVEVPAATSIEEAWLLVNTSERTGRYCMMLENVCYGRNELMVLNMVHQGVFGELLHGEAAYIHELRWQMHEMTHKTGSWRTQWHARYNGNLYPTHGLGPVSQYMNINRGDRFDYLTSTSSPALGRKAYAKKEFAQEHQRNQLDYIAGDMNTSVIKTALGRTIMVQHDTTTPRPYSRHNLIQGTNGVFAGFPNRIALETGGTQSFHQWDYDMAPFYQQYDHPLWKNMGQEAERNGGHGGMDFLMFWRIVFCLRHGEALDQDVYDAAAWSSVFPLSVASVADRSNSQDFPDFTRGKWKATPPLGIVS